MRWTEWSYYGRLLDVPNLMECTPDRSLDIFIARYEKEFLSLILGECILEELYNQIETDENGLWQLKESAPIKWQHLIYGYTYETGVTSGGGCCCGCSFNVCEKHTWRGLRQIIPTWNTESNESENIKVSPIAYYVYWHWLLDNRSMTTGVGEQIPHTHNSVTVDNRLVRVDTWNLLVEYIVTGSKQGLVSLYQFIKDFNKISLKEDGEEAYKNWSISHCWKPINYLEA